MWMTLFMVEVLAVLAASGEWKTLGVRKLNEESGYVATLYVVIAFVITVQAGRFWGAE